MCQPVDWESLIVELVCLRKAIDEVDTEGLSEYRLPALAATAAQLDMVEAALGEPLDPGYRAFLAHAGGWPAFWQTVDLFGPTDLLGTERFHHAAEMLSNVEDEVLDRGGLRRGDLLPIAASSEDVDLFVIARPSRPASGLIVWLAGAEIDRFPTFEDFFVAIVDYNRHELGRLMGAEG